jgi:hypothetical protein
MISHRLMNSHFIDMNNNALVNALLAKLAHEHDSKELMRVVHKNKYSRQHHELVVAVMVWDQQNTLKKIMDEQRHCSERPIQRLSQY